MINESSLFIKLAQEADVQVAAFYNQLSEETLRGEDFPDKRVLFAQILADSVVRECMEQCFLAETAAATNDGFSDEQKNIAIAMAKTCNESIRRKFEIQE